MHSTYLSLAVALLVCTASLAPGATAAAEIEATIAIAERRGWSAEQLHGLRQFMDLHSAGENEQAETFASHRDAFLAMLDAQAKTDDPIDTKALITAIQQSHATAPGESYSPFQAHVIIASMVASARSLGFEVAELTELSACLKSQFVTNEPNQPNTDVWPRLDPLMMKYIELSEKRAEEAKDRSDALMRQIRSASTSTTTDLPDK